MSWGSEVEQERRLRIQLAVYAYAYEYESESLISDEMFDALSNKVNPKLKTGRKKLDKFFAETFDPRTGIWIRKHPELNKVKIIYENFYKK